LTKRRSSRLSISGAKVEELDIQQAADYLNVSKSTIRRWSNMGILECARINCRGDRRFTRSCLDSAIAPRRPGRPKKNREQQYLGIAGLGTEPPKGHKEWEELQ